MVMLEIVRLSVMSSHHFADDSLDHLGHKFAAAKVRVFECSAASRVAFQNFGAVSRIKIQKTRQNCY